MNQVYLSGIVADPPMLAGNTRETPHAVFQLCVSHKTSKGEWRRELYTVNSWNNAALWVTQHVKQGQRLALEGYLTQRVIPANGGVSTVVEITSQEFLPLEMKLRAQPAPAALEAAWPGKEEDAIAGR